MVDKKFLIFKVSLGYFSFEIFFYAGPYRYVALYVNSLDIAALVGLGIFCSFWRFPTYFEMNVFAQGFFTKESI